MPHAPPRPLPLPLGLSCHHTVTAFRFLRHSGTYLQPSWMWEAVTRNSQQHRQQTNAPQQRATSDRRATRPRLCTNLITVAKRKKVASEANSSSLSRSPLSLFIFQRCAPVCGAMGPTSHAVSLQPPPPARVAPVPLPTAAAASPLPSPALITSTTGQKWRRAKPSSCSA